MKEPYTIEVAAPEPSNAVRSHDHPILESGNLSFPNGRYILDIRLGERPFCCVIEHRVEGAELIKRLVGAGHARYVCVVSSPISSYRRTHISADALHEVSWNVGDLGESPLLTPMILCMAPCAITIDSDKDGTHRLWNKQRVNLRKGSRLALGSVIQFQSSLLQLLSLREDEHLGEGQFFVDVKTEPFRFHVRLSTGLHRFLRFPKDPIRNHIMTHIVTACLALLQDDYSEDDGDTGWQSFRNLKALSDYLEKKGHPHWSDSEFRPEKVATALYPHILPKVDSGEESEA